MSEKQATSHRELDKKTKDELVKIAKAMIKDKLTIRQAVEKFGIARATLHKRIHNHLPSIDQKLYDQLCDAMGTRSKTSA